MAGRETAGRHRRRQSSVPWLGGEDRLENRATHLQRFIERQSITRTS
jgi:hypothetical protein